MFLGKMIIKTGSESRRRGGEAHESSSATKVILSSVRLF